MFAWWFWVATMTINVEDNVARDFRSAVAAVMGKGKGKLGRAVSEALASWTAEKKSRNLEKALAVMNAGYKLGKLPSRDEIHRR